MRLTDEQFTKDFSQLLFNFLDDLADESKKDKIQDAYERFEGDKSIVHTAITDGLDSFAKDDTNVCKTLINFIEFYNTGHISKIDVEVKHA
jgi:hypothetical protein